MKNVILCSICNEQWVDCPHHGINAKFVTSLDYQLQKARREIAENTKSINYKNYSECPNCWGTGWFKGADCTWCSGKGFIPNISVDNVLFLSS